MTAQLRAVDAGAVYGRGTPGQPQYAPRKPDVNLPIGYCAACWREQGRFIPATFLWKGTSLCDTHCRAAS